MMTKIKLFRNGRVDHQKGQNKTKIDIQEPCTTEMTGTVVYKTKSRPKETIGGQKKINSKSIRNDRKEP